MHSCITGILIIATAIPVGSFLHKGFQSKTRSYFTSESPWKFEDCSYLQSAYRCSLCIVIFVFRSQERAREGGCFQDCITVNADLVPTVNVVVVLASQSSAEWHDCPEAVVQDEGVIQQKWGARCPPRDCISKVAGITLRSYFSLKWLLLFLDRGASVYRG